MKQKELFWVALLFIAIPLLFFHESLFTDKVLSCADILFAAIPWNSLVPPGFHPSNWDLYDQAFQFFPWLSFCRDQIREGSIPLWNPYNYCGSPLLANGQSAVFSPFHLLFYALPFLKMFSVSACLRLFIAGFFMFLFIRSLGVGIWGSILSGLSYQTCGFLIILLNHPHSSTACFLPLLFWLTERLCQNPSRRRLASLSAILFLQFLSGHIGTAFMQLLVLFCYGVYRSKGSLRTIRFLLLAAFLGISASALVLLPTFEYTLQSHIATYRLAPKAPLFPNGEDLKSMLALFFPRLYGTSSRLRETDVGPRGFGGLNAGFTGLTVFALALVTLFGRKERNTIFFMVLTLVGFGAAYHLPILVTLLDVTRLLRVFRPTCWFLFSAFSVSLLAGVGFNRLASAEKEQTDLFLKILSLVVVAASLLGIGIFVMHAMFFPEVAPEALSSELRSVCGFLIAALILTLGLGRGALGSATWKGGILFLVIAEHLFFGFRYNPAIPPERLFPTTPGIRWLQSDPDPNPFRILSLGRVLFPDTTLMYHLQEVRGWDAVEYEPYMRYITKLGPLDFHTPDFKLVYFPYYNSPLIDLLNVKYVLSSRRLPEEFLRPVYDGEMKIYRNLRMFPRAHLFTDYQVVPDPEGQLDRLTRVKDSDELRKTVFLKGPVSLPAERARQWKIDWVRYEPNRLVLDIAADGSGILFLSEIDYPGWKAFLDGKRTEILRANYLFRSVVLPPGTHRMEMRYDPLSFKLGCWVSGASILTILCLFLFL